MNSFWAMIAIVCVAGVLGEIWKAKLKIEEKRRRSRDEWKDLTERLCSVERRLANVESLLVEREKEREFDRAL